MDFSLTPDQIAFQDAARLFATEQMAPQAARWDAEHVFPETTLREVAALGFGGIYVRDDVGGSGLSRLDCAIIIEALATACPSTTAYLSIHNMAAGMIDAYGGLALRQRLLPSLCSMQTFASYCLTEPNAGSDAAALTTRAVLDGDHYIVNGAKAFISGGGRSDIYVVMVRTGGEGPKGISCLVVENSSTGLSFGKQEEKLGWHSQPTSSVMFDNCRVPVGNRLGAEGEGFAIAMRGLDGGRINIGACSLGAAQVCLELALEHVTTRKQFGKTISDFQSVQFALADMATEIEAARLLLYRAAASLDAGLPEATQHCAMAKRLATDVGFKVVNEALQLFGGYGYLMDYPIERFLRDVRVHQILEGTNQIMRVIIARKLLACHV